MVLLHAENRQSPTRRALAAIRTRIARFLGLRDEPFAPMASRPRAFAPSHPAAAQPRAFAPVTPVQPVARRFSPVAAVPQFHAPDMEGIGAVYFVSDRRSGKLVCLDWLHDHGVPFQRVSKLAPASEVWLAPADAVVLVDIDPLGGIAKMVEPLMKLRLHRPDLTVILLTEEAESHDFGLERLALCDVTLRVPCSYAAFEFAIVEAPINNRAWQERMENIGQI